MLRAECYGTRRNAPITPGMVWFFERQQSRLHYEIRRQSDGDDYELVINWPDGRQEVERYSECGTLVERSSLLQTRLAQQGGSRRRRGCDPVRSHRGLTDAVPSCPRRNAAR